MKMKRIFYLICLTLACLSMKCQATAPADSIRFIFDSHLYLQATLNDTIPVTLIYDTGADLLYLDKDYLKLNGLQNAFGRKGKAQMGGAGNDGPVMVEIFIDPVKIRCGSLDYTNKITPAINLREILGRHTDGMLGNTHLLQSPLMISFSEGFIRQTAHPIPAALTEGYSKLEARFNDNRIDVKAKLTIDSENIVEGWFRMDLGCGAAVMLTNESSSGLHLEDLPKARFSTQAGGVGGGSDEITLRAAEFTVGESFENMVIDCSLNEKGALSKDRPYLGLIGNEIWSLYDIIIDPVDAAVWVKRNDREGTYSRSSTTHMAVVDRTDICDGWIVNGLYEGGIAQKAGFEIGDIILSINGRPVKDISWKEQREGLGLEGETIYTVRKKNGETVTYTLFIKDQII